MDEWMYKWHLNDLFCTRIRVHFLADRTNGRAIGTVLRLSSSVVVVCL